MCDIELQRKDGFAKATAKTEDGRRFLEIQYEGEVKIEDSYLATFLEYLRAIGLTSRLFLL